MLRALPIVRVRELVFLHSVDAIALSARHKAYYSVLVCNQNAYSDVLISMCSRLAEEK